MQSLMTSRSNVDSAAARIYVIYRSLIVSFDFARSCRDRANVCCIAITSRKMVLACSGSLANTISKALSQSVSPILTYRSTRSGSKFEISRIRSGWDGKSYSSASGE